MRGDRASDGRMYLGNRPDELAESWLESAAAHGIQFALTPDLPVVPVQNVAFTSLTQQAVRSTWGEIDQMLRHWSSVGCTWVNLRLTRLPDGTFEVIYEARPDGEPVPDGALPACNGGADF